MGRYWDDDFIAHSSGPWKKHKYIKKIGEGANAIYQYARDLAGGKQKDALSRATDEYNEDVRNRDAYAKSSASNLKDIKRDADHYKWIADTDPNRLVTNYRQSDGHRSGGKRSAQASYARDQAQKAYTNAKNDRAYFINDWNDAVKASNTKRSKAQDAYDKTLMGRTEKAGKALKKSGKRAKKGLSKAKKMIVQLAGGKTLRKDEPLTKERFYDIATQYNMRQKKIRHQSKHR